MIRINSTNTASQKLRAVAIQLPTIAINAINRTAFLIRQAEQDSMRAVFDRPTPWIISTIYVEQATLAKPTATIGPNDYFGPVWQKIIAPHVYGGTRPQKLFETRLVRAGLLPVGWYAMPAKFMPLDGYGNPVPGELVKILSWLSAFEIGNLNPNSTRKNKTQQQGESYLLIYPGRGSRLPPGVYKRVGRQLQMMLYFTSKAAYSKRLPWFETAQKVIDENLNTKIKSEIYNLMEVS